MHKLCVVMVISIATKSDMEKEEGPLPCRTLDPPVESNRLAENLRFMSNTDLFHFTDEV